MSGRLLLIASFAGLLGCSSASGPETCTLIGCYSGLEVILEEPPPPPYRVEAYVTSQRPRYVYRCESQTCPRIQFEDFTPYRAFIEVISPSGTQLYEVVPEYTESRPNGPGCEPLCRQGVVRLPSDQLGSG